jgi:hypothetical protein
MKSLLPVFAIVILCSCANNANDTSATDDSTVTQNDYRNESELSPQQPALKKADYYVWEVDADARTMRMNSRLPPQFIQVDTLLTGINEKFPQVLLEKRRVSNDTLYTEIRDASYLTNQMGSLGAEYYIANAVLNLTAVEGINYVRIDFAEGSHAAPDVWSKASFNGYKEVADQ